VWLGVGSGKMALFRPAHQPSLGCYANTNQWALIWFSQLLGKDNLITVRRIQIGETDLYKQVRLASLRDAPYAFGITYESALQRSAEIWRDKAENTAQGTDGATFIAFSGDVPIGMAAIFRIKGQADIGELMQVWIAPEYRGTNTPWELMNSIFRWAAENNFRRIIAGVTKVNARAQKFYVKYGFAIMEETSEGVYLVKEVT
jgi:RimJ/RimL family protein N-acetyltransferase